MNYGSKTTFIGLDTDKRKLTLSKRFVMYAYDKDTGEIFGRTPSSWGKSSLFFSFMSFDCDNRFDCVSFDGTVLIRRYWYVLWRLMFNRFKCTIVLRCVWLAQIIESWYRVINEWWRFDNNFIKLNGKTVAGR